MLCYDCLHNQATIHIAPLICPTKRSANLCPQCWQKRNAQILGGLSVGNLLSQLLGAQPQQEEDKSLRCGKCGMTFAEFQKSGRLGCANCYAAFGENMRKMLGSIHGHTHHVGKVPGYLEEEVRAKQQIDDLRRQMDEAVRAEDFERAAELRDRIRALDKGQPVAGGEGEEA